MQRDVCITQKLLVQFSKEGVAFDAHVANGRAPAKRGQDYVLTASRARLRLLAVDAANSRPGLQGNLWVSNSWLPDSRATNVSLDKRALCACPPFHSIGVLREQLGAAASALEGKLAKLEHDCVLRLNSNALLGGLGTKNRDPYALNNF